MAINDHPPYEFLEEGNNELRAVLDAGLQILKNTGKYNEIFEKWFGVYENNNSLWETRVHYFLISFHCRRFSFSRHPHMDLVTAKTGKIADC